ncbi:TIGR02536 family ethanolamine utilization protein [Listeria seeligeri]|uniref:TIGR02536 family ethanolamine utilization protein n=1 Tax=Listeria seeligeri TaxID=1640 RepID=UPI001628771C|nr:TIGR02536 family ethanolamine utilization protein [Listeria seeligeri]MBC1481536.1 ethanolamine utilization protein [Listeria seeligeri]MBF2453634.1 ethanolamine utilization protein [Listeria seeligeri]MBF2669321.1 ethanolamine utilization protein [Listeria seeligeri]
MNMDTEALIKAVTEEVMKRLQLLPTKKMIIMGEDVDHTLRQCYKADYQVSLYDRSERSCDFLLLETIEIAEMARISLLAPMNKKEQFITDQLLQGVPVAILKDGVKAHDYRRTTKYGIRQLLQEYEDKLTRFGVEFITNSLSVAKTTKVITAQDVEKRTKNKSAFILPKGSFLTPLAKDYLQEKRISIKES